MDKTDLIESYKRPMQFFIFVALVQIALAICLGFVFTPAPQLLADAKLAFFIANLLLMVSGVFYLMFGIMMVGIAGRSVRTTEEVK